MCRFPDSAAAFVALLAISALACGGGEDVTNPNPPTPSAQSLHMVSGDRQRGATGGELPAPLRVRVIGSDDLPLPGATIEWEVIEGEATLAPARTTTGSSGEAETRVTIGAVLGPVVVRARVEDLTPVTFSITALDPSAFTALSAGAGFTCALTVTGAAYCWGYNGWGQFGDGTTNGQSTPVPVSGGLTFVTLSAGGFHTCGVTSTGAAYCWGDNRSGKLGDGTTISRFGPAPVAGDLSFVGVSATVEFTCGVTTSGSAYCWGENPPGVVSDFIPARPLTPALVAGDVSFTAISAGSLFICGLTGSGAAYCWGNNGLGQLGDGSDVHRRTPGPVAGGLSFVTLSAGWGGFNHTCGVTAAGTAYCWGPNFSGSLGDGTTTERSTPVPVAGGLGFATVDAGAGHSCALTTEGIAYCWGGNRSGELGDGTTTDRTTPVPVAGSLKFAALSAGLHHTCALTDAGEAYCWGYDSPGEGAPLKLTPTRVER